MDSSGPDPDASAQDARTRYLVARLRSGSAVDFPELYERIAPSLWAWARLRLGSMPRSSFEPEDLLQEVWLRAVEALPGFQPDGPSFRAWIFGIAKNVAFEIRRRQTTRRAFASATSRSESLERWPDIVTSIRSRLAKDESARRFLDHVATLDPVDRMLLIHCGLEGLPCSRAAVRLGLQAAAATKRWQRLRSRLRENHLEELLEA